MLKLDILDKIYSKYLDGILDLGFISSNKDKINEEINQIVNNEGLMSKYHHSLLAILCLLIDKFDLPCFAIEPFYVGIYSKKKSDINIYGDFITEIYPLCLYATGCICDDELIEVLTKKTKRNNTYITKGFLLNKFFRQCWLYDELDTFYQFIEKNLDNCLFDGFYNQIVNLVNLIDNEKAIEYLDKFYKENKIDSMISGRYFEYKFSIVLKGNDTEKQVLYDNEQLKLAMLEKLERIFDFKIINKYYENYDAINEKNVFYHEYFKLEKKMERIVNDFLKKYKGDNNTVEWLDRIFQLDISPLFSMIPDYKAKVVDAVIFLAFAFESVAYSQYDKNPDYINDICYAVIYNALEIFEEYIEKNHLSLDKYDEEVILYPSFVIDELAKLLNIQDYLSEFEQSDLPSVKA